MEAEIADDKLIVMNEYLVTRGMMTKSICNELYDMLPSKKRCCNNMRGYTLVYRFTKLWLNGCGKAELLDDKVLTPELTDGDDDCVTLHTPLDKVKCEQLTLEEQLQLGCLMIGA